MIYYLGADIMHKILASLIYNTFISCLLSWRHSAFSSLSDKVAHHSYKLFKVNFSVSVDIYLLNYLLDLLFCEFIFKVFPCEQRNYLSCIYLSGTISIKHNESVPKMLLSQEDLGLHSCCYELYICFIDIFLDTYLCS